jgi:hypothetical protein
VRDEQVRRYARHILLPDVGGLGQTALMVSTAHLELRESEPAAELIAASYLAAGGVGTIAVKGADDSQIAILSSRGADSRVVTSNDGRPVVLAPRPSWWPAAPGDDQALAFWRGGLAAVRWMADVANR